MKQTTRVIVAIDVEHDTPVLVHVGAGGEELLHAVFPEAKNGKAKLLKTWFRHEDRPPLGEIK